MRDQSAFTLYSAEGSRKYLTGEERAVIFDIARMIGGDVGLFCWVLLETGCRLSEALALRIRNIDVRHQTIIFESLKKRSSGVFRAVPVSEDLLAALECQFGCSAASGLTDNYQRLWNWSRTTAWRRVRKLVEAAGVRGAQACPKGFRHGFGVAAVSAGIPLNLVQRWLGHEDLKTTAIYTNASGPEERDIASRIWMMHPHPTQPDREVHLPATCPPAAWSRDAMMMPPRLA